MEPKTGKRIVSKGEYTSGLRKIALLSLFGIGAVVLGIAGLMFACWLMLSLLFLGGSTGELVGVLLIILGVGVGSFFSIKTGRKVVNAAQQIDPGVPLTRANTADLPAPDSLVRASSEPLQAQEGVLLRAAAEGVDTPAEELVRASEGQA